MTTSYRLPEEFNTSRFHLRRVTTDDATAIFRSYATDADVTRYLGWKPHKHIDQTSDFLTEIAQEWDDGIGFPLVVFAHDVPDDLIGMFHPHIYRKTVNYGYVLCKSWWSKGAGSEILSWLVDHALTSPYIHRTEAFCDVENPASARVMEKSGMVREGILRRYFTHPNISDEPRDCIIYSKTR